jgi:ParB family chromosome partitioning protein
MIVGQRKKLGSELKAILGEGSTSEEAKEKKPELKMILAHQLCPGKYQPRRKFDEEALKELSDSISSQGILQPIVARELSEREFEIIAGERRWRAAQMAGLQSVPVVINNISDEAALAFGLIENIQRQNLNPIEEDFALKRLIEEFGMTHEEVAKSIGKSRALVTNMLRLLNLAPQVQKMLIDRQLDVGHVKVLLTFSLEQQEEMAEVILNKKMSVRSAEKFAQSKKHEGNKNNKETNRHNRCEKWAEDLTNYLSLESKVQINESGSGKITLKIDSEEEIMWLIDLVSRK